MEPRRFLTPSGRTRRAREAKMGALEASPRVFRGALEALWTRLDAAGASRRGPGSPKWMQNRYKILSKRVSVTVSGPDLVFIHFLIVFGVRRCSKLFKLHCKNVVILNIRIFHSQDMKLQNVFQKTCKNHFQNQSKFD